MVLKMLSKYQITCPIFGKSLESFHAMSRKRYPENRALVKKRVFAHKLSGLSDL